MWTEIPKEWNEISTIGNPKEPDDYLIFTKEKYTYVASWTKIWENKNHYHWVIRCECSNAEDCLLNEDMITHWMVLPGFPI